MTIRIQDTLTREKRELVPVRTGHVGMYLCGMTVQDRPHVGHMRSAIMGDVVRRYLAHRGYEVTFVYNFTDVDDRIIAKGNEEGVEFAAVSKRNIDAYFEVADKLNIMRATHYPKATEHIAEILEMIERLETKGLAYKAGIDVYFRVGKFPGYGKLSGRRIDELEAGARIAVGEEKEDPLDFTLWKGAKPGEPAWESKWGPGRPGWHIECSAMSRKYLGDTFDIHAGGHDLVFPHHENEIAQSEGANGVPFANYWMHNGMVNLGGEKMSKSTQHFFLAKDILAEVEAPIVRYYLMSTHYRSPIEFNRDRLAEAGQAYGRLTKALAAAEELRARTGSVPAGVASPEVARLSDAFHEAMDDDFNSARAISHVFELAREVNRGADAVKSGAADASAQAVVAAADVMVELAGVLGLELVVKEAQSEAPAEIVELLARREAARKSRDFATADALRDEILGRGFAIEDRPEGPKLVRR